MQGEHSIVPDEKKKTLDKEKKKAAKLNEFGNSSGTSLQQSSSKGPKHKPSKSCLDL